VSSLLSIAFKSEVIYWRGPSPFYFIRLPDAQAKKVSTIAKQITYGWGVLPADVTVKGLTFYTALFPKDSGYLVPLKKDIREKLEIELGDIVQVKIDFSMSGS